MILDRPLIIFDLETTGLDVERSRVVEIAAHKLNPDGTADTVEELFFPECQIPAEIVTLTGITNERVADKPKFWERAAWLLEWFAGCDLGGFNVAKFDGPLLAAEFKRCSMDFRLKDRKIVDAKDLFMAKEKRGLAEAVRFYLGREHVDAHSAASDAMATAQVIEAQAARYAIATVDEFVKAADDFDANRWVDRTKKFWGLSPLDK